MASQHDFDVLFGRWTVGHHKLSENADPACTAWVDFGSTSEVWPVLEGIGHVERIYVPVPADTGPPFEGMTLRLYEPETDTWRIHWSSTRAPGRLDPPVVGRFDGAVGTFEGEDTVAGRPLRLRFTWDLSDPHAPRWEQRFSWDGGESWHLNWVMRLERARVGAATGARS